MPGAALGDDRPRYAVLLTAGAEQDLESIHDYLAGFDSVAAADHVLDRLIEVVQSLAMLPARDAVPVRSSTS